MINDTEQSRNRQKLLTSAAKNPKTGCWHWRGQISNSGYGRILLKTEGGNHMESAHRASYIAFIGPIPEGMYVRQTCGNRLCINPDHLALFEEGSVQPSPLPSAGMVRER